MDHKKSPIRRAKRQAKVLEDNFWDCSVCTFRNTAEAFKCLMCDVRKGTSTRKPRINPQLVAQQVATQFLPAAAVAAAAAAAAASHHHHHHQKREKKDKKSMKKRRHPPRLKNVDRSTAQTREVTVNSVTVIITEYKPKIRTSSSSSVVVVDPASTTTTTTTAVAVTTTPTSSTTDHHRPETTVSSSSSSDHGSQSESSMDAR